MNQHATQPFTADRGAEHRPGRSRPYWIVFAAIVFISAGVVVLLAVKLQREQAIWQMDPGRIIIPLDRPAEFAASGEVSRALTNIDQRLGQLRSIVGGNDASFAGLDQYLDWDDPETVITAINVEMLFILECLITSELSPASADAENCDESGRNTFDGRIDGGIHGLARAFLLEAQGTDPIEVAELYAASGRATAKGIAGWGSDRERREVAARVRDFASARAARLSIIWGGMDDMLWTVNTFNALCLSGRDEVCPGGVETYRAIDFYLKGRYADARSQTLAALEGQQPWVYRSVYEHPLLWLLAASSRNGNSVDREPLRPLIDAALSHWPNDARLALLAFVDPDDSYEIADDSYEIADDLLAICSSAGCRYFLAQFFYGTDDVSAGDAMTAAGLDLCEGARSIPCTALRASAANTAAALP